MSGPEHRSEPLRLRGHVTDLVAGLQVRRLLPALACRSVGPFVFMDHFGPVVLPAEVNSDVGVHPHIGLATVTYLLEGRQVHRDSLGTVQAITPGAINWMTAGRGIVHSERAHPDDRGQPRATHGVQLWAALPPEQEETDPGFQHVAADAIPELQLDHGVLARVAVGQAWHRSSPVRTATPTLLLELRMPSQATVDLSGLAEELAVYGVDRRWSAHIGTAVMDVEPHELLVFPSGGDARISAGGDGARLIALGGEALKTPVRMWWNFVSTDRARIAQAARNWQAGGFPNIPGEHDRIAAPPWREQTGG